MPALSEDQLKQSGYYFVTGTDSEVVINKLYRNKHFAQPPPTDPLLYERPQQAGTCTASSKMFYLRSFGLQGRLFEIDFKVELIKQLLDRIDRVHTKGSSSRAALANLRKGVERARLDGKKDEEAVIMKRLLGELKALNMEEVDEYILLFPDMFVSLIASALNDLLTSLYWIIEHDKSDMAKTLFEHFLEETEPVFKESSTHGPQLLDRVSPLIRDLHGRLLKEGAALPFGLAPTDHGKRLVAMKKDAVELKMDEIRENCMSSLSESSGQETGLQSGSTPNGQTTCLLLPHHRRCLCLSICTRACCCHCRSIQETQP